jgi:hypothetical protein
VTKLLCLAAKDKVGVRWLFNCTEF